MISKKTLRVLAILACLGFITFTFSGVALAAEKKVQRPDVRTLLQKPIVLLNSLFNLFLNSDLKAKKGDSEKASSGATIKITGNLKSHKVSDGD